MYSLQHSLSNNDLPSGNQLFVTDTRKEKADAPDSL